MRKRSSGYYSDKEIKRQRNARREEAGEKEDYSLLLKPLPSQFKGFQEAKQAYERGTKEVRQLLMHECSLIYECNVCRNMFRSLANFISHKRIFCCNSSSTQFNSNSHSDFNHSVAISVSPEQDSLEVDSSSHQESTACDTSSGCSLKGSRTLSTSCRDLTNVIERLKLDYTPSESQENGVNDAPASERMLPLEGITNGNAAIYQANPIVDLMANKVADEAMTNDHMPTIKELLNFGRPQAQAQNIFPEPQDKPVKNEESSTNITNAEPEIVSKPQEGAFKCPSCPLTFTQPSAVIRHLANEHKKPVKRLRLMRETYMKNCKESHSPSANDPANKEETNQAPADMPTIEQQMKQDKDTVKAEPTAEAPEKKKPILSCSYCSKTFERRAAYASHFVFCRAKHENLPNPIESKRRLKAQAYENEKQQQQQQQQQALKEAAEAAAAEMMNGHIVPQTPSFGEGLRIVSLVKLNDLADESLSEEKSFEGYPSVESTVAPMDQTDENDISKISLDNSVKEIKCRCKICNKQFNALGNVRRHISMFHYRSNRFGCKICQYRAFRRYDIVNHLGYVHKMQGDRDQMDSDYVIVHEVNYTKDELDNDIVMITDEQLLSEQEQGAIKEEGGKKRSRRKRTALSNSAIGIVDDEEEEMRPSRQGLKRSQSFEYSSSKGTQKRPIRNRTKPVNKDFVYDLSKFKDKQQAQPVEKRKRSTDVDEVVTPPPTGPIYDLAKKDKIKTAVRCIAMRLIKEGLAKSATLPELPTERPQVRPRHATTYRNESSSVPVVEPSELEAARLKSPLLDYSFVAKSPVDGFKLKPCLEQQQQYSALNSLLQKVDSSLHCQLAEKNAKADVAEVEVIAETSSQRATVPKGPFSAFAPATPIAPALPMEIQQSNGSINFNDPEPSIPKSSSPPPTPRKHMSLLQQLVEHTTTSKARDSLLRTALEH